MKRSILVAEDRVEDAEILEMAFRRAGIRRRLDFVRDGNEAVHYLEGAGRYSDRGAHPLPTLMLLDLKMPLRDGFDVLTWLRKQPTFGSMVVIVFTTSAVQTEVKRAYRMGANSYVVKPGSLGQLEKVARNIEDYWFGVNLSAELPWDRFSS